MFGKKRKKNVETSPLQSYEVGRIKENKYWFIKLVLFFGFFVAVIHFLPQIGDIYNKLFQAPTPSSNHNTTTNNAVVNNVTENNTVIDETKNYFNVEKSVKVNNVVFSGVTLDNQVISFKATSALKEKVDLEKLNIYFEVYDQTDNLLKRYAVLGDLPTNVSKQFSFSFKGEANYYEIKEILEEDYTYIDLSYDDKNISTLTCIRNQEKIIYTFNNEKLSKINHSDKVEKTNSEYDKKYTYYNDIYVNNRNKTGVSSSFSVEDDILSFKMIIDYTKAAEKSDNRLYFAKDTSPRIVNFKVESWEYECS